MLLRAFNDWVRAHREGLRLARAQQRLQQLALLQRHREAAAAGRPERWEDAGFGLYSQNDEDGLLLYAFALAGFATRVAVEIAAGNGVECNSANLICNHGFAGLLFETDEREVRAGRRYYAQYPTTRAFPPRFVTEWVTRENAVDLVRRHMFEGVLERGGEIDLLSLDLDGNDYWVLEALLSELRPRVAIVEFNAVWGARRAVTIPYEPGFKAELAPVFYGGASLPAFVKLLGGRGYRLVGVERLGFNALFVRNDLAAGLLPGRSAEECLKGPIVSICQAGLEADPSLSAHVLARPWVDV